jgi:hypothetical protein
MPAPRSALVVTVTVRRFDRSEPLMVFRDLTADEADRVMANVRLMPGEVANRVEALR